ncbi:hypothetical protein [Sulfurirhabdus autotrophica]|uniref:Uncharacterized protein n=1 Tax=Sulfurirhabdus autotrophica TaxID=1706046 RepID=A0A4R3XZX9_9PROT|nr:hypothetical protein [Sulfurirhabdus autotrophica]TCV83273.1 hypothetical protein EDC63_11623 [Sulfurirhabdus autotrophica]
MKNYFEGLDQDDAELIESLSRLTYVLRENRKSLLEQHGVEDEQALLSKIMAGETPEHPAYENYLSACILAETRDAIRNEMSNAVKEAKLS